MKPLKPGPIAAVLIADCVRQGQSAKTAACYSESRSKTTSAGEERGGVSHLARPSPGRYGVYSRVYLGKLTEQRYGTREPDVHILGTWVRESPTTCFGAGD